MKLVVSAVKSLQRPFVFGMIHVPALPGTPSHSMSVKEILNRVRHETKIYAKARVDGILVENMHDIPYIKAPVGPEITATMTAACSEVSSVLGAQRKDMMIGVQVLAGANQEAIAIAHATGLDLIRAECFVFSHVADEGWMDGCAGHLLRYRKSIGADNIAVFTDIKKKHSSHSVTSDLSIGATGEAAEFFLADGLIVTGSCTGQQADPTHVTEVQAHSSLPVFVGSGVTSSNASLFSHADGFIVGSEFKKNGKWQNELDPTRIEKFMKTVANIKKNS